jgi:hypothetical protein
MDVEWINEVTKLFARSQDLAHHHGNGWCECLCRAVFAGVFQTSSVQNWHSLVILITRSSMKRANL